MSKENKMMRLKENKNRTFRFLRRGYEESDFLFLGRRKRGDKKWRIF